MWNWICCYCLSFTFTLHLGNLIVPAFNKKNMIKNPLTGRSQYSVWNEELQTNFNYSLKKGVRLSEYAVIMSVLVLASVVGMWFFAEHWWQCLIALFLGFVFNAIYEKLVKLEIDSTVFYVELIANPLIYGLMVYFLIWY